MFRIMPMPFGPFLCRLATPVRIYRTKLARGAAVIGNEAWMR
jgi:hypothetical protein